MSRRREQDDDGYVLACVLGIMAILVVVVPMMTAAMVAQIGWSTAGRAAVGSRTAAESGIAWVQADLARGRCTTAVVREASYRFEVTIHSSATGDATRTSPVQCPTASTRSVLLVSTGTAAVPGVGNSLGDTSVMEARLNRPVDTPRFAHAMTSPGGGAANTNLTLQDGTGSGSADLVVGGELVCATRMTVGGSVYAGGDVTVSSSPCAVDGDLVVGGDFVCASGMTVGGDLHVTGRATFSSRGCTVAGRVVVGGDAEVSVGGTALGTGLVVGGDLAMSGAPPTSVQSIAVGGRLTGSARSAVVAAWGPRFQEGGPVAAPDPFPAQAVADFPRLTASDPDITTGFTARSWSAAVAGSATPGTAACRMTAGGDAFATPIRVDVPTRFDTRTECPGGVTLGMGVWLELAADAVLVADGINQNGNIRITSADGRPHSLYLVDPWPDGAPTCTSTGTPGINLTNGTWTQDPVTSVLLYSARPLHVGTSPTITGQVFGCTLSAANNMTLVYSPVGAGSLVVQPSPTARPWELQFIRDSS